MVLRLTLACTQTPVSVLVGHTGKVSRAIFDRTDVSKAYSAGWDHTVRSWDLSIGAESAMKVRVLSLTLPTDAACTLTPDQLCVDE